MSTHRRRRYVQLTYKGTKEVSVWPTTINGINVALLDTPGFDDTHRSDAEMLEDVATWLAATFEQNILLSGVIFLEPVNTTRVSGSEHRRIRLFEKICGKHAFSNIVIASTMWSSVSQWPSSRRKVRDLMKQRLKTPDFWGHMTLHGARYEEHADTKASAHKIIRMLLDNEPKPLQLQVELQGNGSRLYSTTAGRIVADDLEHTAAYLSLKIKALKEEQMSPGSEADDLLEYLDELERNLEKLQEEQKRLRVWKVCGQSSSRLSIADTKVYRHCLVGHYKQLRLQPNSQWPH